jgi:hypothetical protein
VKQQRWQTGVMQWALAAAIVAAGAAAWAQGGRVTFTNNLREPVELVLRTGPSQEGESCEKTNESRYTLAPGARKVVEAGNHLVCYCWSPSSKGSVKTSTCAWDGVPEGEVNLPPEGQ